MYTRRWYNMDMFDRFMNLLVFGAMVLVGLGIGSACSPAFPAVRFETYPPNCGNQLPLLVTFDELAEDLRPGFETAAETWEEALGQTAFIFGRPGEVGDVHVTVEAAPEGHPRWVASTLSTCDGSSPTHAVRWHRWEGGIELYVYAAHELGHALGLNHSTSPKSLMYHEPVIPDFMAEDPDAEPPLPRVTDGDRIVIRRLYGQ
jgi:hypothetical protein